MLPHFEYLQNFNSIKVRLKLAASMPKDSSNKFQFHKGTIKTADAYGQKRQNSNFNSIKVRLKPKMDDAEGAILVDFNSIKVRLKLLVIFFRSYNIVYISIP